MRAPVQTSQLSPNEPQYDLHTHSRVSDGTDSPAEIAQLVSRVGLAGFALTDHDTAAGWDEARSAARAAAVEFLPGMEITTRFHGRSTHLLAYGFHRDDRALTDELALVQRSRVERAREMVRRLNEKYRIDWEAVVGDDQTRTVGRPHIADALVRAGHFASRDDAFATVLGPNSPFYVHTYAIDTTQAIRLVTAAGGVAVLAHPAAARNRTAIPAAQLGELAAAGVWGIELSHPENVADRVPALVRVANELGLRVTGASDYHGTGKSNRLGQCSSSAEVWHELRSSVAVSA